MARPIKQNASYFSHDADMRNNRKVKALRTRFALEGYAVWCMILECLTDENGFVLPWDTLNIELISGDFGVSAERLKEAAEYMDKIRLVVIENETLHCPAHRARMQFVIDERERKRQWKQVKKDVIDGENPESDGENAQRKLKEIKGNKTKLNLPSGSVPPARAGEENFEEKTADGGNAPTDHHAAIFEMITGWNLADDFATLNAICKRADYDPEKHGAADGEISRFIGSNLGKDAFREKIIKKPIQFFVEQFPGWLALPYAKNKHAHSQGAAKQTRQKSDTALSYPIGNQQTVRNIVQSKHPKIYNRFTDAQIERLADAHNADSFWAWLEAMVKTHNNGPPAPRTNGNAQLISTNGLNIQGL